jgi:hypothetical protein
MHWQVKLFPKTDWTRTAWNSYIRNWKHTSWYRSAREQVVTSLLSSRGYQDVFALLVSSCCDRSGTSCNHLLTITDLLQVVPTRPIQWAVRNKSLRTCRRYQVTCWNNLLRVCWPHQLCCEMITTCSRLVNNWEQAGPHASCWQAVRIVCACVYGTWSKG